MSEEEGEHHQHQRQFRQEREARSLALEKAYVHDVYAQIAPHFAKHRSKAWPRVCQFLVDLEPGSLVCDVGCGNGKYLSVNPEVYNLGSDRCRQLADIAREKQHELVVCDNLHVPFRDESFDAALSVAVIHHLATTERRVQALRELARILRLGGRLMISVWAMEQRHRRFESQDVLVPWYKPVESSSEEQASHNEGEMTSTTTSDDDLLNYHAHSQLDSDSCSLPSRYGRRRHKMRTNRGYCRNLGLDGPYPSSSQSSSDLSSPNETCYSFVRRALQKFSNSRGAWDDPRRRCRPWFVPSPPPSNSASQAALAAQDSGESIENAADLPIELRDVDAPPSELDTPPNSPVKRKSPPHLNHKSKSLSDLLGLFTAGLLRGATNRNASKVLGRSKSTHTHLTRVEENSDEVLSQSNSTAIAKNNDKNNKNNNKSHKNTNNEQCRRPRSLIILNAEDKRNGNTILPDMDSQIDLNPVNKRASWPAMPQKLDILPINFAPLHTTNDSHPDSQRDSGVEDLNNGGNGEQQAPGKTMIISGVKNHHPPIRLKRPLVKQIENVDLSEADDVMRDLLCDAMLRKMMARAKLFPSHSMPDLHSTWRLWPNKSQPRSFTIAPVLLRNGFKGRNNARRKESLPNGYNLFKRSLSLDNNSSQRSFEPRERVYCNRITKEDSLQRDTSYDSDDSVASVIAVHAREPGTTSDTSLDSEDSCISVIAMPNKHSDEPGLPPPAPPAPPAPPPDVLQSTNAITPDAPDLVSVGSPTSDHSPNAASKLPDLVRNQNVRVEPIISIDAVKVRQIASLSRCSSEGADDGCDTSPDRKVLRKAGSLPEQGEPRQNGSEKHLLTQPAVALSASADTALGSKGVERVSAAEWGLSGGDSLSSSRSSSNSSISWEKFLDASRCVVLDNIAVVSAGSEVVLRSGKGSAAILKNASDRYAKLAKRDTNGENSTREDRDKARSSSPLLEAAAKLANVEAVVDNGGMKTDRPIEGDADENVKSVEDDVEFKEAGVQTSLILYSSENERVNSPRFEDRLNGNLPSTHTPTPTPGERNVNGDFISNTCSSMHETGQGENQCEDNSKCLNRERSLSVSTSDESLQCAGEVGGSLTLHRYYHVFREGELDQLIEKYVENLHIISSYYDHANWCIIAEKVQVWRI